MQKKILTALILGLTILTCTSCKATKNNPQIDLNENTQELEILKSDLKLTQEQTLSRIKAEHLKQNNGYLNDDEVISIITLPDESIIDTYLNKEYKYYSSVSDYASSPRGQEQLSSLKEAQQELVRKLKNDDAIIDVEYNYSTILNGVAVKTTYGKFKSLENKYNIQSAILSDTYNQPQSTKDTYQAVTNLVKVYETGIFDSSSVSYTGNGTAVAVLDSGFDCSHTVFSKQPDVPLYSKDDINNLVTSKEVFLNAKKFTPSLRISDVYYSSKIPYAYDYADKDTDVFPYDSEHGTHVAGIIGGYDDVITGIAINTQLVLMKVFPDLDEGGKTEDILAALEDAVVIGVDAINMSLGSSCGFAREVDKEEVNKIYERINESGISLITAASNSYSSGFGGEQGNTNFVTNPDSGTVGSPSTYDAALSVASISGVKSKYLVANDSQILFFKESNAVTGKENDFFKELGINEGESKEFEYVTIPGVGLKVNYARVDVKGKIALVKRGDNTFEEKARYAKQNGAVACIIYNNIDGDITMSMGKSAHIPTISISKDDGTILASKSSGKILISYENQAGPFISDFSSWGPTPSLGLKPEITAHGGSIKSSIPGGGYDELSGTSMATPNLCGIVVLIRQYLKEKYPDKSSKEIAVLTNELLMSTATIALNEEGNPYSPRKQGAGLASLDNAVNTKAYITVDGIDRTKLELGDDPKRTGKYEMNFNVENLSADTLLYDLDVIGMTESVSTSDSKHVAEKAQLLNGNIKIETSSDQALNGVTLTLKPYEKVKIKVTYTLSNDDKNLIDSLFPYGMYVEGFVTLKAKNEEIDLNIPFLAFYGDWTEAPMFDKTYYEVESEAHNGAIDDEDKIKADYLATTPYGSYFYNYIIPLGSYLYNMDETTYDPIPASTDHIAISNILGTIDGISGVYTGLLRNAKSMTYQITDKITGEVIYEYVDYNAGKAYSVGGSPMPYYDNLKIKSQNLKLINNHQYEFKMTGLLDYKDGGATTNVRNSFNFDFVMDNEAPVIKDAKYEKVYDENLKKDRYYITLTVYDNQYVQSITPIIFTSSSSYTFLTDNPIPVYSQKGKDNVVKFEITDYLDDIFDDSVVTSSLAFSVDDYALNSNIYLCQLPGTKGDFKFTKDGTVDGSDLIILSMYENDVIDLTKYLATKDETVDDEKAYLNHLVWKSSNTDVAEVKEGLVKCKKQGRATIIAREQMDGKQAVLIINVKKQVKNSKRLLSKDIDLDNAKLESLRFSYFDTIFAYSRAAQTSVIGSTGDREFINALSELSFYPGEQIQLHYDLNPWYVEDKYELTYTSSDPSVAIVDQNGLVKGLKEGTTIITLQASGSKISATLTINIKNPFVIENRTLVAYKGLGGEVIIPDDEGILYIGSYAFCLYETDRTIELPEDDYDANKIPAANTSITKIVVPYGVEEIQKYAFYNCSGLKEVVLPDTIKTIREYSFCQDKKLEKINLEKVTVIGREAFKGCTSLNNIDLSKIYAIGADSFSGCTSLEKVDLSTLRNTGKQAFKDCTVLKEVVLSENTKLSYAMFVNSGIEKIDIYEQVEIPEFCFALCSKLTTVNINNDIINIGKGAFSECHNLVEFNFNANVLALGEQAFYASDKLERITLPNCNVTIGNYCFYKCSNLKEVTFDKDTYIEKIEGSVFQDTALTKFIVSPLNKHYKANNQLLLNYEEDTIIIASGSVAYDNFVLDEKYKVIASGAFAGCNITSLTILNKDTVIEDYAFVNCNKLEKVSLPAEGIKSIGKHAFNYCSNLKEIDLSHVKNVSDYAFANTALTNVILSNDGIYGEGAFFQSKLVEVTIGASSTFGLGAFQKCSSLKKVVMPDEGNVHFGVACFANDLLLQEIDLTKTSDTIEDETFYGCTSLKVANLLNVKTVGKYAFADCGAITYLSLPIVEVIKDGAFSQYSTNGSAPQFSEVNLPNTLKSLGDGVFFGCNRLKEITIPSSLTKVSNLTFGKCINLVKVTLPKEVKEIGENAFIGCELLEIINLENVEIIGVGALATCKVLETVDLASVKTIGEGAFANDYALRSIGNVLNNLVKIDGYAFLACQLENVNAPSLEEIGEGAFQDNIKLKEFVLSSALKHVGTIAFYGCTSLESFYFGTEKLNDGVINSYALLKNGVLYTTLANGKYELTSVPHALNIDTLEVIENTVRIDSYAGSGNKNISMIILPDSLKSIGNYAFYEYANLKIVEFRSFTAPILESAYNSKASLSENDPGYKLLHKYFDLFGYELCYYQFINLVGKNNPIARILPSNADIEGYDTIIFEAYFGKMESAERSNYEAMHKNIINFVENAKKIEKITKVLLTDATLINDTLTSLNAVKQDYTKYGITKEEWDHLVTVVKDAKAELRELQFASVTDATKNIQKELDSLNKVFDIKDMSYLKDLKNRMNALPADERVLLDLTNYNELMNSYNEYLELIQSEITPVEKVISTKVLNVVVLLSAVSLIGTFAFFRKYLFK